MCRMPGKEETMHHFGTLKIFCAAAGAAILIGDSAMATNPPIDGRVSPRIETATFALG